MNKHIKVVYVFFVTWIVFSYSAAFFGGMNATTGRGYRTELGGEWIENKVPFQPLPQADRVGFTLLLCAGLTLLNMVIYGFSVWVTNNE